MEQLYRNDSLVLAHWTYTKEEWKTFLRWKKQQNGFVRYLLYRLRPRQKRTPEIMITHGGVWVDEEYESFHEDDRWLKRIHIKDTGDLNVIEIMYELRQPDIIVFEEIQLPVPKGKLKEAIKVEDILNVVRGINLRD